MLLAEQFDPFGKSLGTVAADAFDKASFYELSVRDRLRCTSCGNTAVHVSACAADGNTIERIAHFRANHKTGCTRSDEARGSERAQTIKQALQSGTPILINIDFNIGFKKDSLSLKFNPLVDSEQTGLWTKSAWAQWVLATKGVKHLSVPAHDITDVLYYLELAKQAGGQEALSRLWFNTGRIVQSCKRFVIADSQKQSQRVLQSLIDRAYSTRTQSKELRDTPRLFLFHVTGNQIKHAQQKTNHAIYGQALDVNVSVKNPRGVEKTKKHVMKLAMRFADESGINNQNILQEGSDLWVIGQPALTRRRAFEIRAKVLGDVSRHINPAFCYLRIIDRPQFVRIGAPRRAKPPVKNAPQPVAA
jgi:hypothetical protein